MVTGQSFPNKCPKCKGSLILSYGVKQCLACGTEPMSTEERRAWWREHKADIAADVKKIGGQATIKKWSIPVQLIAHLYYNYPSSLKSPISGSHSSVNTPEMPKFPDFKDSWMADVQKKWLDIWLYLVDHSGRTEEKGE